MAVWRCGLRFGPTNKHGGSPTGNDCGNMKRNGGQPSHRASIDGCLVLTRPLIGEKAGANLLPDYPIHPSSRAVVGGDPGSCLGVGIAGLCQVGAHPSPAGVPGRDVMTLLPGVCEIRPIICLGETAEFAVAIAPRCVCLCWGSANLRHTSAGSLGRRFYFCLAR